MLIRKDTSNSPLAPERNDSPIPLLIRLLLNRCTETNSTHNPIAKLLIQHRLVRIPIILHNLKEPVNQRLARRQLRQLAAVRQARELRLSQCRLWDIEELGEFGEVFGRGARLAVEEGGAGYFVAAQGGGDGFEGDVLAFLRFE